MKPLLVLAAITLATPALATRSRMVTEGDGFTVYEITIAPGETYHQPPRGERVVCWLTDQHKTVGTDARIRRFNDCKTFAATQGGPITNTDKSTHRSLIIVREAP